MKFTFIFLISVVVVSTHQYFYNEPKGTYWQSPYSPQPFIGIPQPFIVYFSKPIAPKIYTLQSKKPETYYIDEDDSQLRNSYGEPHTFPDTELRIKGFNRDQQSNEQQQDARFLFTKHSVYTYPFFKTVTFTTQTSLSLTFFVTCVPANQVLDGVAATACRRKRSTNVDDAAIAEENQLIIAPSETQKLTTTAISSSSPKLYELSSSKDDTFPEEMLTEDPSNLRQQRFLFANKNRLIISSTVTSFSFSNATVTVTRNLFNAANQGFQCVAVAGMNMPVCVTCLPAGYVVCNAAG
ncbi:uncharacterized protein LOC130689728 [Daphnia carinata]|uniref:uncharacterized protein LOC130689728 n=1 Tax=Daphnia carinata TaxID=120202 RepID=UPI002580D1C0|nr:uncharacterized protein LOC130689728 [Daphnia carinata]